MSIETISLVLSLTVGFLVSQFICILYLDNELKKLKLYKRKIKSPDDIPLQGGAYLRDSTKPVTYAELSELRADFEKNKEFMLDCDERVHEQLSKLDAAVAYPKAMSMARFHYLMLGLTEVDSTPIPLSKVVQMLVDKAGLEIQQNPAKPAETVFVKKKK